MKLFVPAAVIAVIGMLAITDGSSESADRSLLWRVVQVCVANNRLTGGAFPCLAVDISRGIEAGYAVVRAPFDTTHIVVTPTAHTRGIESNRLQGPEGAVYFADAWASRHFVAERAGRPLKREDFALAVNSRPGRSQDQLHIHVDCLKASVREVLDAHRGAIGATWSRSPLDLQGDHYWALRLKTPDLAGVNVFKLAVDGLHVSDEDRSKLTLVAAATTLDKGEPGFYLLAALAGQKRRNIGHGEFLLDNSCSGH